MTKGWIEKQIETIYRISDRVAFREALERIEDANLDAMRATLVTAKRDLKRRLEELRLKMAKKHCGDTYTYDNLKVNLYVEWVKDFFGDEP